MSAIGLPSLCACSTCGCGVMPHAVDNDGTLYGCAAYHERAAVDWEDEGRRSQFLREAAYAYLRDPRTWARASVTIDNCAHVEAVAMGMSAGHLFRARELRARRSEALAYVVGRVMG